MKKKIRKMVEVIAIKVATADANTACPCMNFQPKLPVSVKKLRNF